MHRLPAAFSASETFDVELSLTVEGRYDPVTDVGAIRRAHLEQRIDAKREGASSPELVLEGLYSETFSPERLEAERQGFMPSATASASSLKEGFDAGGFYDALRSQLLEADVVPQVTLNDLARARAAAITAALTSPGGLDASRVKVLDPAPVKRKKQDTVLVASEMTLSAGD